MGHEARKLLKYTALCGKAAEIEQLIQDKAVEITNLEAVADPLPDMAAEGLLQQLHDLRTKKLELELALNKTERQILKFQLARELAK